LVASAWSWLLWPGIGSFGLESAPTLLSRPGVGSSLSGLCRSRLLSSSLWAGLCRSRLLASWTHWVYHWVYSSRPGQNAAGVGCFPLCPGQESAAHLSGSDRSRLLTSLSRPGVGSLLQCLAWLSVSLLQCLDWSELVVGLSASVSGLVAPVSPLVALCWWTGLRLPASVVLLLSAAGGPGGQQLAALVSASVGTPLGPPGGMTCFTSCGLRQCTPVARSSFTPSFPSAHSFSSFPQSGGSLSSPLQCQWSLPVQVVSSVHSSVGHSSVDSLSRSLPVPVRSLSTRFILRFYDLASLYFY